MPDCPLALDKLEVVYILYITYCKGNIRIGDGWDDYDFFPCSSSSLAFRNAVISNLASFSYCDNNSKVNLWNAINIIRCI
jgi:hypothetical protein